MKLSGAAPDIHLQGTATHWGQGGWAKYRDSENAKFKAVPRVSGLLRTENRPSAPPGTFRARGGALCRRFCKEQQTEVASARR
jgi:hypothetical protein